MSNHNFPKEAYSTDPIIDAVLEIRFTPNDELASHFIFTTLYNKLKGSFPNKEETDIKSIPKDIVNIDRQLKYQAMFVLRGDQKVIKIGNSSVAIACTRPYVGWAEFQKLILEVLSIVKEVGVISSIERVGLRYTNFLDKNDSESIESQFTQIKCNISLGSMSLTKEKVGVRTEFVTDNFLIIAQAQSDSTIKSNDEVHKGLVVDIDVIRMGPFDDFWTNLEKLINDAHDVEKRIFFDIVKSETMDKYDH